jgi:hypothetical protein
MQHSQRTAWRHSNCCTTLETQAYLIEYVRENGFVDSLLAWVDLLVGIHTISQNISFPIRGGSDKVENIGEATGGSFPTLTGWIPNNFYVSLVRAFLTSSVIACFGISIMSTI